jgi:hypothetical protein
MSRAKPELRHGGERHSDHLAGKEGFVAGDAAPLRGDEISSEDARVDDDRAPMAR